MPDVLLIDNTKHDVSRKLVLKRVLCTKTSWCSVLYIQVWVKGTVGSLLCYDIVYLFLLICLLTHTKESVSRPHLSCAFRMHEKPSVC